jgi:four helix bundle protein
VCLLRPRRRVRGAPVRQSRDGADREQLDRAASAAAANYRATTYSRSHAEFCSKLSVALEEADEARHWLQRLLRRGARPAETINGLLAEATALASILGASYRTAKRNERNQPRRDRRKTRTPRPGGGRRDRRGDGRPRQ